MVEAQRSRVGVDVKALVDKVLGRYATDFGTLRELIQNADDAGATSVAIEFVCEGGEVTDVLVRNDGRVFTTKDWDRVKTIASGNPDAEATGLFGVGFYSSFSLTDTPRIESGSQQMSFSWESDELFTEKSPRSVASEGTVVVLPIKPGCEARDWAKPAELEKLQRTVASTILFLETVKTILVRWTVDGDVGPHDFLLERTISSVRSLPHSSGHGSGQHPPLFSMPHQIDLSTVVLRASLTGEATQQWQMVQVSAKLAVTPKTLLLKGTLKGLAATLKKEMPKSVRVRLTYDWPHAGVPPDVFANVSTDGGNGHIFIGAGRSDQRCGAGFNVAGKFLVTTERISLDFQGRECSLWNRELLMAAGAVARSYQEDQEKSLAVGSLEGWGVQVKVLTKKKAPAASSPAPPTAETPEKKPEDVLTPSRVTLLKAHTFSKSTPHPLVGQKLSEAFLLNGSNLVVPSTQGPMPASEVLWVAPELKDTLEFLGELPLVPPSAEARGCQPFYEQLRKAGALPTLDAEQLNSQLSSRVLSADAFTRLLKWYVRARDTRLRDAEAADRFRKAVRFEDPSTPKGRRLAELSHAHPSWLPSELPTPPSTLPPSIAERLAEHERSALRLKELTFDEWWSFVVADGRCLESATTAPLVLATICKHRLARQDHDVLEKLRSLRCVKCMVGDAEEMTMSKPAEAFLPSAMLWQLRRLELPAAALAGLTRGGELEDLLLCLGVRRLPPLARLLDGRESELGWSHRELVEFLERASPHEADWEELGRAESEAARELTRLLLPGEAVLALVALHEPLDDFACI